jgi:phosphoglucosamine mutase
VVGTLMSNFGLERALGEAGIGFLRANVGDRYVLQMLKRDGGVLGGETSGHILTLDRATTGDAIVSALQVLEVLVRTGRRLDEAVAGMRKVAQTTVNVRVGGGARALLEDAAVQQAHAQVQAELDGHGRVVLRASGTEPLVRVTVEADDDAVVQRLAGLLSAAVQEAALRAAPALVP